MAFDAPSFVHFSELPLELRLLVWSYALPPPTRPTLYQYEPGHAHYRIFEEEHPRTGEMRRMIRSWWKHDLLRNHAIPAPLTLVNQEARCVMQRWLNEQKSKLRLCGSWAKPVLLRDFQLEHDAIFIRQDQMVEATRERDMIFRQPELRTLPVRASTSLRQIAVPEALFYAEPMEVVLRQTAGSAITVLWIIIDPPPLLLDASKQIALAYYEFDEPCHGIYRTEGRFQPWIFTPGPVSPIPRLHDLINAWTGLATHWKVAAPGIPREIRPVRVSRRYN